MEGTGGVAGYIGADPQNYSRIVRGGLVWLMSNLSFEINRHRGEGREVLHRLAKR